MKQTRLLLLLFTFLLVFGSMRIAKEGILVLREEAEDTSLERRMLPAYTSHGVIEIENDTDLAWQAGNESWSGDGSQEYPYVIQGYHIHNDTHLSIQIRHVSLFIVIRDCLITSTVEQVVGGVYLYNVSHCVLENCIIESKSVGLVVHTCNDVRVVNCSVKDNSNAATCNFSNHTSFIRSNFTHSLTGSGLMVQESHWTYVNGCRFIDNHGFGVHSFDSSHLNVTWSSAGNNTSGGFASYSCYNCTYHSNSAYQNGMEGIYLDSSEHCNITCNTVHHNDVRGIILYQSHDTVISHNIVFDNDNYGVFLWDSNNTMLYYNDLGWNWINAGEHMTLPYVNYWSYGLVGNWYSDYSGTGAYTIPGTEGSQDPNPSNSLLFSPVSNRQYELGSTGNTVPIMAQALNPWYYEVLLDTEAYCSADWDGGIVHVDIDGLDVGVYNFSLRVFHVSGHMISRSAFVTVVDTTAPEWAATPVDQTLDYGEPLEYELQATDISGISMWIINDTLHFSILDGVITNSTILDAGSYGLNITVIDMNGNARSAIITVHVRAPGGPDMTLLYVVAGAAIVLLGIAAVVIVLRRRNP